MRVETKLRPTLATAAADAQLAEAVGYDGVVTEETAHDPFFPLLLAADHTTTLELGTSVAIAFPRSPMITANLAWDLQGFSNGRLRLGLGPQVKGHNERRFSVPWSPPAPRLREYVLALRAIWNTWATGAPLDFRGQHYSFTLMTPVFSPEPIANPHIPVEIAAVGPVMARVAGEVCDGLRLHPLLSPKYLTDILLPNLEIGAGKAGRKLSDIQLLGRGFVIVGDSDAEIRRGKQQVAERIAFYGSTRTYQGVLDVHGWGGLTPRLHEMSVQGKWQEMGALITNEMLETFAVIGAPEQAADQLIARYATLLSSVNFEMPVDTPEQQARARRVIARLKKG